MYTLDNAGNFQLMIQQNIYVCEGYENALALADQNGLHSYALIFESNPDFSAQYYLITRRSSLVRQIMNMVETEGYDCVNIDLSF